MLLVLVLPVLAALVWVFIGMRASSRYSKLLKDFPAPSSLPIIGHAKCYWGDEIHIFKVLRGFRKDMGTRWAVKVMHECAINLCDASAFEAVMTSSKHIKKGPLYDFLLPWLGRGLLTNFGSSWHQRRKLLTPAFHFKILDEFGPLLAHHSTRIVENLKRDIASLEGPIDIVLPVSKVTLGSICETAMGVNLHACGKEDEYFKAVRKVALSVTYRLTRPWTWRDFIFNLTPYGREVVQSLNTLHSFTRKVILERKASNESQGSNLLNGRGENLRKRRLAFLDMLLAAQMEDPSLTDDDIRQEVDTFMFEGHETTAMAICWTLFSLGNNPDIQERVREEVLSAGDNWQAIVALPYLEMVVKESLRLYPPVLYISRVNEQGMHIGDKEIAPGVHLDLQIFLLHRDPANFPDPERFDPERFSPEQERGRHPFAFVPFSGGLRNCIGRRYAMMELKLMVAAIVGAFSMKSQHSPNEMEFRPELVLRPSRGIQMHLTPLH